MSFRELPSISFETTTVGPNSLLKRRLHLKSNHVEFALQLTLQLKWRTKRSCTTWDKSAAVDHARTYTSQSMTSLYDEVLSALNVARLEIHSIPPTKVDRRLERDARVNQWNPDSALYSYVIVPRYFYGDAETWVMLHQYKLWNYADWKKFHKYRLQCFEFVFEK